MYTGNNWQPLREATWRNLDMILAICTAPPTWMLQLLLAHEASHCTQNNAYYSKNEQRSRTALSYFEMLLYVHTLKQVLVRR